MPSKGIHCCDLTSFDLIDLIDLIDLFLIDIDRLHICFHHLRTLG